MNQVDVIIVGQGIAGTLLAHELEERHLTIAIIDKPLPASASRVAAGIINPVGMKRCIPSYNASVFLPFAFERYRALEKKLGDSFFHPMPIFRLFANEDVRHEWQIKYSNTGMHRYIEAVMQENTFHLLNDSYGSAKVSPAAYLEVNKWLAISRSYFKKHHLLVEEQFDYSLIDVNCPSYKGIQARYIIFCEGFKVINNPFFSHLPLSPTKGEVMRIKLCSHENLEGIVSKGVYVLPVGNGEYLVGSTYDHNDLTDTLTDQAKHQLTEQLEGILSVDFEILDRKAGVRPTVKHRKPLFGLHKNYSQIGVFNGLGTRGLLQGPHLSTQFSDNIINRTKTHIYLKNKTL